MDKLDILIIQDMRGGDEQHVHMTPEQIQRNIELRTGEGFPMFEYQQCTQQQPASQNSSASGSGHAAISAASTRRTDAVSSEEETERVPDPRLPVAGTLIATAPPATTTAQLSTASKTAPPSPPTVKAPQPSRQTAKATPPWRESKAAQPSPSTTTADPPSPPAATADPPSSPATKAAPPWRESEAARPPPSPVTADPPSPPAATADPPSTPAAKAAPQWREVTTAQPAPPPTEGGPPVPGGTVRRPPASTPREAAIALEFPTAVIPTNVIPPKAMPLFRWTFYPPGRNRKPTLHAQRIRTPAGAAPPHAPMPTRPAPCRVFEAHEVHPSAETDWALVVDLEQEQHLRDVRNSLVRDMLRSGRSTQWRQTGNSLSPMVRSGDVTMWEPVTDHTLLEVGDVVFCAVQPGDRFYGHMIHKIGTWNGDYLLGYREHENPASHQRVVLRRTHIWTPHGGITSPARSVPTT